MYIVKCMTFFLCPISCLFEKAKLIKHIVAVGRNPRISKNIIFQKEKKKKKRNAYFLSY